MSVFDVVFKKPQFFRCDRFKCRMLKKRCLERRQATYPVFGREVLKHEECQDCAQGVRIRQEILVEMPLPNPVEGKGMRGLGCKLYSGCVGIAAKKNWQEFNCEQCDYNEDESLIDPIEEVGVPEKTLIEEANEPDLTVYQENTRICEQCGQKPTITPKHKYCPHCMAEMSKQKAAESRSNGPGQKASTKAKARPEKAPQGQDQVLTVDFSGYPDILKQVQDLAAEQIRPVESQVIYILKSHLDNAKEVLPEK